MLGSLKRDVVKDLKGNSGSVGVVVNVSSFVARYNTRPTLIILSHSGNLWGVGGLKPGGYADGLAQMLRTHRVGSHEWLLG